MSGLSEHRFGLVLVGDSHHAASIEAGEVEDRLPEGDEDVLGLSRDKRFLDQFSPALGNGHRFPLMAALGEFGARRSQSGINLLFLFPVNAMVVEIRSVCGPRRSSLDQIFSGKAHDPQTSKQRMARLGHLKAFYCAGNAPSCLSMSALSK